MGGWTERKTAGASARTRGAEGQPNHHLRQFRSSSSTAGDHEHSDCRDERRHGWWGLVVSMARPGGNTTGISILGTELDVKRFELLHEFAPQAHSIAVL